MFSMPLFEMSRLVAVLLVAGKREFSDDTEQPGGKKKGSKIRAFDETGGDGEDFGTSVAKFVSGGDDPAP